MPRSSALLAVASALLGLTVAREGAAYCRATTCLDCEQPRDGCISEGRPLYWPVVCLSYDVQRDGSRWVPWAEADPIADAAFRAWADVTCPGTGVAPSFLTQNRGPVVCAKHEFNDQESSFGGNANVIVFRDDDWDAASGASTLALTSITFNTGTGEIYDADIEVNSAIASRGAPISGATQVAMGTFDLQSILTHEVGHFLGLGHSVVPCTEEGCPTMNATYRMGDDDFRTLGADDIAGVCALYPPDRRSSENACAPRHGFSSACGTDARGGCCSTTPGGASGGGALYGAVLALGLCVARFRRV